MPDPRPLTLYAVVRKTRRGEVIISDTISRTRRDARRIYTDFYVDDYMGTLAQEFRSGLLRVAPVTVSIKEESAHG